MWTFRLFNICFLNTVSFSFLQSCFKQLDDSFGLILVSFSKEMLFREETIINFEIMFWLSRSKENDEGYVIDRHSLKVSGYALKNFDGKTNITIYPMKTLQWLETNYGFEAVSQWIKSCPDTFGTACKIRQYSERPYEFYSCEIAQKAF